MVARDRRWSGVSIITSWAPIPFILSNIPSPDLLRSPYIWRAGNLLGITRSVQPGVFGWVEEGLKATISGGVVYSLPGQKGQNPPFLLCTGGEAKSVGLFPLSTAIMTQPPEMGSF